jgi:UDP-N-acetylmuramoyl-tripeptide--D-alanyl-D-alanine ligase
VASRWPMPMSRPRGILFDKARAVGARLVRFGVAKGADIRMSDLRGSDSGSSARAVMHGPPMVFRLPVPGAHNAMNALIALAVCDAVGADVAEAAMALAAWEPVSGRGTRERLDLGGAGDLVIDLIDDAFNANPASLAAGLDVLAARSILGPGGRRVAILGDMLELGGTRRRSMPRSPITPPWPGSTSCTPPDR